MHFCDILRRYLRDNAKGSCSGENPEENLKINEIHWLVAAEKFPELVSPITALLKQPQRAVEEVRPGADCSSALLLREM